MTETELKDRYAGRKALITGGAGFIGRRLRKKLEALGAEVYSLDSAEGEGPRALKCDVRDAAALAAAVREISPEFVFHLAGRVDRTADAALLRPMLEVNFLGALNLFEALKKVPVCRAVLLLGTGEEYGRFAEPPFREDYREDPVGPYSFSKFCATRLAGLFHRLYGLPAIVLRPTLAYGPGQEAGMFIPSVIETLRRGEKFAMTAGEQVRDFIFIDDLVSVYLAAGAAGTGFGGIFNIGSGETCSIRDLAMKIGRLMGREKLLEIGARPYRPAEIMDYRVDFSKAVKAFGWKPETGLERGLQLTIAAGEKADGK